ncbi:DNA polymerase zeta [Mortierella sp. AM989]|nr:DNA polymerase zeta [Mortierella sp. AM989]
MDTSTILSSSSNGDTSWVSNAAHSEDMKHNHNSQEPQHKNPPEVDSGSTGLVTRSVRFKIRIADLDYYMAEPGPLDLDTCQFLPPHCPVLKVPVVRVYGANEAGQKTCLHIHRAYPYFYIPYDGSLEPPQLQAYIHQLGMSLNHAACITFNSPQDLRRSQYVAAITPVKGVPFYGYHVGYSYFLKIYLFNPDLESRIVDLLRSGAIMATQFQTFESHIPFKLQFFIDYNLYGMGWLELEEALLRNDIPAPMKEDHPKRLSKATVSDTRIWSLENDPGRISHCEIEMDSTVDRIVNRDNAPERNTHTSLKECFKPPPLTVQVPSMAGLWEDDARRRKANNLPTQELPKSQMRDPASIPWLNHDLNKQMVADLIREIMSQSQTKTPTQGDFNDFNVKTDPLAESLMTAYESVEYLCPRETSDPNESFEQGLLETSFVFDEADSSILVDESIVSQAAAFGASDMGTRKEIFKGLTGLGGLEEQDDEDDFPLPDMDDFEEEYFMDGGDLWDDMDSSDVDSHSGSTAMKQEVTANRHIPQFDGGDDGESSQQDGDDHNVASEEWRKVTQRTRSKRTRSFSSSSSLISKDRAVKSKRFCEIVASSSSSKISNHHARSSEAIEVTDKEETTNQQHHNSVKGTHVPTSSIKSHAQGPESPHKKRRIVRFVEIPKQPMGEVDTTKSGDPVRSDTTAETPQLVPKLIARVSDDPILVDESGSETETQSQVLDITHGEGDVLNRDGMITIPSVSRLGYQYPEPVSPDHDYFLSAMDEMWSSPSPPLEKPAFIYSPPRPTSPDLAPTQAITIPSSQSPSNKPIDHEFITLTSPTESHHPNLDRHTRHSRRRSSVVDQTFLIDPSDAQEDALDTMFFRKKQDSCTTDDSSKDEAPLNEISEHILAEDSMIADPFTLESSQPKSFGTLFEAASAPPTLTPLAYRFTPAPPTTNELLSSLPSLGLVNVVHQKPYFSNDSDVPSRAKVFGGKEFRIQSNGIKSMPVFKSKLDLGKNATAGEGFQFWEPNQIPPTRAEIQSWLEDEMKGVKKPLRSVAEAPTPKRREQISQLEGPTPKNPFGYKNTPTKIAASIAVEKDFLDVLSLELHCRTRANFLPDPKTDPILAIFYCWQTERDDLISNGWVPGVGIFTHAEAGMMEKLAIGRVGYDIHVSENEGAMLNAIIEHVRDLDPDILAGYEVHNLSWGYLVDRYQTLFALDMSKLLSRVKPQKAPLLSKSAMEARDSYNSKHHSGLTFAGRHLFNVWRLIRGEVALTNYGFCNVVFHVLQQRVPHYSFETLTKWWTNGLALHQSRVIRNYLHRVQYTLQLIESQELISRTSEFARVFGVDFFSVISRGSQYKVESMMVRLAKPENYIMISPSRAQVAGQRALEVIPMVMEPESGFYEDPVVVLDFQSLYPSVMIAYNICYSTCLGKLGGGTKLGVIDYTIPEGFLPLAEEHLHVAPNGLMYVNQDIRRGLLGRMLAEILDTRVMIKKAMKEYPTNKSLLKLLDARQLSLKFIANVTYGYTSASYSGRMPGIEIADSIVLSGRETLERSIRFVNQNPKWNARVVYGDTDSMFVHLKGRTRQEAFEIGYDISETITRMNPRPVKLKFEKVYHPCFLVTKKRYVGSSYETPNQQEPIFDAKGIETIRRDGVPAVQKIMETCIKTMFRTQDLSLVKSYFVRQLGKILEGRVPVPDLMFGKEVRMSSYSEKGVPPPGAVVSARRMELDPRSEPQHGERVPYVVVYGNPGARLTDQVVEPKELLLNKDLRLNGEYYIRKHIIPSLERIFQLAGADVKSWYEEMPRVQRAIPLSYPSTSGSTSMTANTAVGGFTLDTDNSSTATFASSEMTDVSITAQHGQMQTSATSDITLFSGVGAASEILVGPPRFKPRRRGGKGHVSVGSRIDRYYQSQLCVICSKMVTGQKPNKELCADCTSENNIVNSTLVIQNRLRKAERLFQATVDVCGSCCRSTPNGGSGVGDVGGTLNNTGTELVACESLECSVFWQRRRAQDSLLVTRNLTDRVMDELSLH